MVPSLALAQACDHAVLSVRRTTQDHRRHTGRMTEVDPSSMTSVQRIALLDGALRALPSHGHGRVLVGGEEASLLWNATVDSFSSGVWVATVLCAQATCERVMAGLVSLRELPGHGLEGPKGWEKWGLGRLIGHVRTQGWVPEDVLGEVAVLCETRKPYGHFRRPFEAGTLGRDVADALKRSDWVANPTVVQQQILSRTAHHAAVTAMRLYFGDYARGPFEP
jgi:hypothetical protein